MHITDWLEMLGEHFPLVVIGCAEALLAVVLLCAALRNRRQCADKNGAHSGGQKGVSVWKKYRAWDGAQPFETVLRTKNGEWVQLNVTCGEDNGYDLFCFSRTTGLCGRIEQYEERLAQSEEESRSKTTFLSRMSHEIRTPMNGIIGMLTLVLLTAGQLGLHMTSGSRAITRRAVAWCLGISAVLCACARWS